MIPVIHINKTKTIKKGNVIMKFKGMKKAISALLVMCMSLGIAGCGNHASNDGEFKLTTDGKYPMQTDETLRIWVNFTPTIDLASMNDSEFKKYLEQETGVKIEFEHPPVGSTAEAFNLLLASKDMPDIIIYSWRNGDADSHIDTGAITDLTPYIEGGAMPNLKKIIDENEGYDALSQSMSGKYYYAPMILGDDILRSYRTYVVRQDLLDKAGLEKPETLEEWEVMLRKFKEMGVEVPLQLDIAANNLIWESQFLGPFNLMGDFYHDGDKIKFGLAEENFEDYLRTMKRWYDEGLIDKNFTDRNTARIDELITTGKCGAFFTSIGGGLGKYLSAVDPESGIEFTPVKIPVAKKGTKAMANNSQFRVHNVGAVISGTCKNKELAARFLDYGYSEEGQLLWNFGKEGVSYTMAIDEETGEEYPKYTDIITDETKRGEGVTMSQALVRYASVGNPISVQNKWYLLQTYSSPLQREAVEYANDSDIDKYALPPMLFTTKENKEVSDKFEAIRTYIDETMVKIVVGQMDLEKGIKEYYETIEKMGINEVIDMYQKAYDRYIGK